MNDHASGRVPPEPRGSSYDVIVVGAGLGGLTAAALLAKAGRSVLVAEQGAAVGGYAQPFQRGPYVFDAAVHFTAQAAPGQILDLLLAALGVRDQVELIPTGAVYHASFPGLDFTAPIGQTPFIEAHARVFPHEADGIRGFVELAARVTQESQDIGAGDVSLQNLDETAHRFPTLFRFRSATFEEALDEHVVDPRARALLGASWPYAGPVPSRLSFLTWAAMLMSVLEDGPLHSRGSFGRLTEAFLTALERAGGEVLLEALVERIRVEDGHVAGITLAGGVDVDAPVIVSNADATATFQQLVGVEHLPGGLLKRLERLTTSHSAVVAYTATTLDLAERHVGHETFLHDGWDHDEIGSAITRGELGGLWMTIPTLVDDTLAPPGEHIVILTSHMPYDIGEPWSDARDRYRELLLDRIERALPGFRDAMTFCEIATPETLRRYALNRDGAIYGWENTPRQATTQRPAPVTPVQGLYLAGHWTQPGTSSLRAMYSGFRAASIVLGFDNPGEFIGSLMASAAAGAPPPAA